MEKKQLTIEEFLGRKETGLTYLRRIAQAKSLTSLQSVSPDTDVNAMTASARICDETIDRANEVILPQGVRTENYALNPVVLYEHGHAGIVLPIAVSEDPSTKQLSVHLEDDHLTATSWFSDKSKESSQIFGLIDADVIRATSIQVIPDHNAIFSYSHPDGRTIAVTEAGEMVEWSWCTLGFNPQALKKSWFSSSRERDHWLTAVHTQIESAGNVLQSGSIGGDRLLPSIRKSLMSLVPKPSPSSPGLDSETEKKMPKTIKLAALRRLPDSKLRSIMSSDEYTEETQAQAKAMVGEEEVEEEIDAQVKSELGEVASETPIDAPAEVTEAEEPASQVPQGAQVLTELHDMIGVMIGIATDALKPVENVTVREAVEAELTALAESQATLQGAFASAYPDLSPLAGASDGEGEAESEVQTQMKAMLAGDQRRGFQVTALRARIFGLTGAPNLTAAQKKSLQSTVGDIDRLVSASRSFRAGASDKLTQARIDKLAKNIDVLTEKLGG